jgi:dihydroorotase
MLKMSIYLNAGMPIEDIVRAASYTPAKVYNLLDKAGSLEVGKPADIAVFRVEDRSFTLEDRYGSTLSGDRMCVPQATFKNGRPVFQQVYLV